MCVHDCLFHWLPKIIPTRHNFLTHHRPAIHAENKITKRTGELSYLALCTYCRPMMSEKIMTSSKKWMEYEKTNIETKIKTEKKKNNCTASATSTYYYICFPINMRKTHKKKNLPKTHASLGLKYAPHFLSFPPTQNMNDKIIFKHFVCYHYLLGYVLFSFLIYLGK